MGLCNMGCNMGQYGVGPSLFLQYLGLAYLGHVFIELRSVFSRPFLNLKLIQSLHSNSSILNLRAA